jgi:hypothetical protein
MMTEVRDRRSTRHRNEGGRVFDAGIIQHGLLLQRTINTTSAIEYFKNKGVDASVIQRVLSGDRRRDDVPTLADPHFG